VQEFLERVLPYISKLVPPLKERPRALKGARAVRAGSVVSRLLTQGSKLSMRGLEQAFVRESLSGGGDSFPGALALLPACAAAAAGLMAALAPGPGEEPPADKAEGRPALERQASSASRTSQTSGGEKPKVRVRGGGVRGTNVLG
jgi:hypothetical protein